MPTYLVEIPSVPGMPKAAMVRFIRAALRSAPGGYLPEDAEFAVGDVREQIKVTAMTAPRCRLSHY